MGKLRFALVGAGSMGYHFSFEYSRTSDAVFTAVYDRCTANAENYAAEYRRNFGVDVCVYDNLDKMLRDGLFDAVYIATPPEITAEISVDAMEHGRHVLSQVPATYSLEMCRRLVETCRSTGMIYVLAEQTRYWQFIREWTDMSRRGDFGKIIFAEGEYLHYEERWDLIHDSVTGENLRSNDSSLLGDSRYSPSWRLETFGHPILYLPHTLSPLLKIVNSRVKKVSCLSTKCGGYVCEGMPVRDIECALMQCENDTVLSVKAGFTTPHGMKKETGAHWYQIKGTLRSAEWSRSTVDEPKLYTHGEGWSEHPEWSCADSCADAVHRQASHGGADIYPLDSIVNAVLHGIAPECDVYTAVETAAPAILAAASSEAGGIMLDVPDFRAEKIVI